MCKFKTLLGVKSTTLQYQKSCVPLLTIMTEENIPSPSKTLLILNSHRFILWEHILRWLLCVWVHEHGWWKSHKQSLLPCLGCLFPPPRPPSAAPSPSPSNVKSQSVGFCGGSPPHQEGPPHLMPDITCTFIHLPKYSSRYRFSDHSNVFCQARSLNAPCIY